MKGLKHRLKRFGFKNGENDSALIFRSDIPAGFDRSDFLSEISAWIFRPFFRSDFSVGFSGRILL